MYLMPRNCTLKMAKMMNFMFYIFQHTHTHTGDRTINSDLEGGVQEGFSEEAASS